MLPISPVQDFSRAVHLLTPPHVESYGAMMATRPQAITALRQPSGLWELHFKVVRGDGLTVTGTVPFNPGPPVLSPDRTKIVKWGVRKLGPRTWLLEPSIVLHGQLHAFVVACDVPEPAPWEGV